MACLFFQLSPSSKDAMVIFIKTGEFTVFIQNTKKGYYGSGFIPIRSFKLTFCQHRFEREVFECLLRLTAMINRTAVENEEEEGGLDKGFLSQYSSLIAPSHPVLLYPTPVST